VISVNRHEDNTALVFADPVLRVRVRVRVRARARARVRVRVRVRVRGEGEGEGEGGGEGRAARAWPPEAAPRRARQRRGPHSSARHGACGCRAPPRGAARPRAAAAPG